jgi:hypothetical protein
VIRIIRIDLPEVNLSHHVGMVAASTKAVMPRHRVSPSASPMTGSVGASSTPRPIDSITVASGILDHPPSRAMTAECAERILRDARIARSSG